MPVIKNNTLRTILRFAIPPLLILLVLLSAILQNGAHSYIYASAAAALLSMLFFAAGYERKKTGARRLMICAAMIALSVVGRFIPVFKPVTALTIISAVYLGPEAGFLVGSMSALISDFYFGLGPWTPFQMLAWGLIGFAAGIVPRKVSVKRVFQLIYAALSGIAFSLIMDTWTSIWLDDGFTPSVYMSTIVSSLPYMLIYMISNVIFILICSKPIGEKLERMKKKYGV